jgi:hypothetical protein
VRDHSDSATNAAPPASGPSSTVVTSPEALERRVIERRAVEAGIWGMPVMNTDLMRQEMGT